MRVYQFRHVGNNAKDRDYSPIQREVNQFCDSLRIYLQRAASQLFSLPVTGRQLGK